MSPFKNFPPIIILVMCIFLFSLNLNKEFVGHHDFNSVYFSQIARNLISYSPLYTKFGQILGYGNLDPKNFNYYVDNIPLYPWILSVFFLFFKVGVWQARIVTIIAALFSAIYVYKIGLFIFNKLTAYLGVLFFALSAMMIYFSSIVFPDQLAMAFVLGAFYYYLKWLKEDQSKDYYLLILFLVLSQLTLWSSYFLSPAISLHYFVTHHYKFSKKLIFLLLSSFLVFFVFLMHNFVLTGHLIPQALLNAFLFRLHLFPGDSVKFSMSLFIWREISLVSAYYSKITIILVAGWFSLFLYKLIKKQKTYNFFLLLPLFFWGISYPLIFSQGAYIHDYFLLYVSPFVAIAAANFIDLISTKFQNRRIFAIPICAILFIFPLIQFFMVKDFSFALLRSSANLEGYELAQFLKMTNAGNGKILVLSGQFGAHFDVFTNYYLNNTLRYTDFNCSDFQAKKPYLNYNYVVYIYKRQDTPLCTLEALKKMYTSYSSDKFEVFKIEEGK